MHEAEPGMTGAGSVRLPAAASTAVETVLSGPARPGRVLAVLGAARPVAVHVATGDTAVPLICLGSADAVRLPCSLVLRTLPAAAPGDRVLVGAGRVLVGAAEVRPVRWWTPDRPRLHDLRGARRRAVQLPADPGPPVRGVLARPAPLRALAAALLGLGPGLTPTGDDVLAGALVALRAVADSTATPAAPAAGRLAATLTAGIEAADPAARTTAVSAALLAHAARGECVPELAGLLDALDGRGDLGRALHRLRGVGGTTGQALGAGVRRALLDPALANSALLGLAEVGGPA